jgi:hypothetical protein
MPTQNATITTSWSKVVDTGDTTFLIQVLGDSVFEVATVATDTDPTVRGHVVTGNQAAVSRDLLGAGHVYAKVILGSSATLVVTGSSLSLT